MTRVCTTLESPAETAAAARDARILWALLQWDRPLEKEALGNRTLYQCLSAAGSPSALWEASSEFLKTQLSDAKRRLFESIRERGLPEALPPVYERAGIRVLPITDADYPAALRTIYNPPLLLFAQGRVSALQGRTLAVVGTRRASDYGRRVTETVVAELGSVGVCIVSGLAAGIDTAAHAAALAQGLPTAAVFGCGLDTVFPSANQALSRRIVEAGGCLLSEYPLGMPPSKYTFPQRNRIVAGLSAGVLVVEGDIRSGALITARLALDEGRTVFAVPGNIFSPGSRGPIHLIQNGATPITGGADILADLGWCAESAVPETPVVDLPSPSLSAEEQALYACIAHEPVTIDALAQQIGWPTARVQAHLTVLELEGRVVTLAGGRVRRQ